MASDNFRTIKHDLLGIRSAARLYVAGARDADHHVVLCAGFPCDHSSMLPLPTKNTAKNPTMSMLDRHYHLLRRLHSLSGVFPVGLFLLPHLTTNSSVVWGRFLGKSEYGDAGVETFQHEVDFIHSLPALEIIEWTVLFGPIAFHAILGIFFARSGKVNVDRYRWNGSWRYALQRLTGYLAVLFIFLHITSLRFGWTYLGLMPSFDVHHAASSLAIHFQQGQTGLLLAAFYLVCVLAIVFHFANGLWSAAITWGLTVSRASQNRWGYACAALGLGLSTMAVAAIAGYSTLDIDAARKIEEQMYQSSTESISELPTKANTESLPS